MKRLWAWLTKRQPDRVDLAPAERALTRATTARSSVEERWEEVETLSSHLRRLRARNHFIEGFQKTLWGE